MKTPAVSVIIAVYNAERYFERCLRSLFGQTLDDIEYIFVDDCTPDACMSILERVLEEYPQRKPQVRIIRNERNMGSAAVRTTGMRAAAGEYVIHCDSDDWVEPQMYGRMYREARQEDADMVLCGYFEEHPDRSVPLLVPEGYDDRMSPRELCVTLWNRLVRRSLYEDHDIYPFEGIDHGEDYGLTARMRFFARKTAVIREALYHYNRCNVHSLVATMDGTGFEQRLQIGGMLERFYAAQGASDRYAGIIDKMKISAKGALLFKRPMRDVARWKRTWPESHRAILHCPVLSRSQKAAYWLAAHGMARVACLGIDLMYACRKWREKDA